MKRIIGQEPTIQLLSSILTDRNKLYHILLIAPSGYGKTLIAQWIVKRIQNIKNKRAIYFSTGNSLVNMLVQRKRFFKPEDYIIFVDEIHQIITPEIIYPLFEITDIIGATNVMGLPEALQNRFLEIPLQEYTREALKEIFEYYYEGGITEEEFEKFIRISRSPRIIKRNAELYRILGNDFWRLVVNNSGLTHEEAMYINSLKRLGGVSSFGRIRAILGYDRKFIEQIETSLLEKGIIRITNKGRELI